MRRLPSLLVSLLITIFVVTSCWAQTTSNATVTVPPLIKINGTLANAQGTVGVVFALYAEQTGGAPLWLETQNVTPDAKGRYTIYLGANHANGVPLSLFATGEAQWLGVQPEGQAEQARIQLVSVPYAMTAGDAQTLGGQPLSAFVMASAANGASTTTTGSTATAAASGGGIVALATPQNTGGNVTTTLGGTTNYLAKFTSALNVENSSMVYDSGTGVGIGTTAPAATFHVVSTSTAAGFVDVYSNTLNAVTFATRAARGTPTSPAVVQAGDIIGGFTGRGWTGSGGFSGGRGALIIHANETWSSAAQSTYMQFNTTGLGNNYQSERMRLDNAGNLGIGTSNPGGTPPSPLPSPVVLEVNGNVKLTANSGGGVTFQDGTTQSTAFTGTNGGVYTAGAGLNLVGSQFSVNFAGTGMASAAARSDHNHDTVYAPISGSTNYAPISGSTSYVAKAGDTMAGALTLPSIVGPAGSALSMSASATQALNLSTPSLGGGSGNGGSINITAGQAGSGSGGSGGSVNLTAGYNVPSGGSGYGNLGAAGSVNITGGGGYNSAGGNVIVTSGTTSPWGMGVVFSKVSLRGGVGNTGDGGVLDVEGGHTVGYPNTNGGNVKLTAGNASSGGSLGGNIVLQPGTGSSASGSVQVLGKLGVGNSNPGYSLDVSGAANATQYCISGANCITAWPSGGGGVSSFNSRTGAVVPASGDYSFSQINGTATDSQITALSASKLTGTVAIANGGTGITTAPATGQYLRGTGTGWALGAIQASDVPSLSGSYVDLSSSQTIAGAKTFSSTIAGNISGNAATVTNGVYTNTQNLFTMSQSISATGTTLSLSGGSAGLFSQGASFGMTGTGTASNGVGVYGISNGASGIGGLFMSTAGGKILSGQNSGTETFSVDGSGNVTTAGAVLTAVGNGSSGTTNANLAKLSGGLAVQTATSDTTGILGVVVSGGGTTGNAQIAVAGQASCAFDGGTTAGDYVQVSSNTAGACHDAGTTYPTTGQVLGRVLSTNGSAGAYGVYLFGAEQRANASGFSGSLAGDVTGTPGATVVGKLQGTAIASAAPASGQILVYNGSQWAPGAVSVNLSAGVSGTLPVANGGTGATTAASAMTTLGAAASGVNGDITSLTALNSLALPLTTDASHGVLNLNGQSFLHSYGTNNTFLGSQAGNFTMTGSGGNTAIGYSALHNNMYGFFNTATGYNALTGDSGGYENSAFGYNSMPSNGNGALNSAFGFDSLYSNSTGFANTAFGAGALNDTNTAYGVGNNTAIGWVAGYYNTTGTNNTYLGAGTGPSSTATGTITNSTAIGYKALVDQSNTMVLGGSGAYAVNVGIGTSTPTQALTVQGNVQVNGNLSVTGILANGATGAIATLGTPLTSSDACTPPQMMYDSSYVYTCVATNTWRRAASAAF